MAVKTSTFTGWKLSGKDADAFLKQISENASNKRAQNALMRGRVLCKEIAEKGYSSVNPKRESLFSIICKRVKQLVHK